ncbi:MAG: response regulator [Planctomycetes bacterium]|nr:response regulator [Planctomycetota bacterium]
MRVLIVDDSTVMRRMIKQVVQAGGWQEIDEAPDGKEALNFLQEHVVDLILTDWNMPNVTGLQLVEAIRSDPRLQTVPIIMITTEAQKPHVVAALKAGVNNYVVKPFEAEALLAKIQDTLSRAKK